MSLVTLKTKVEQLIDLAEWEKVWYEASANLKNVEGLFRAYKGVTIPRTNFINTTTINNLCGDNNGDGCTIEYIDYYLNTSKASQAGYVFRMCRNLKWMVGFNTANLVNAMGMFFSCSRLETIQEPFDFSKVTNTNNTFSNCTALKDIKFVSETIKVSINFSYCKMLTLESVQSIFDGLATVTTAQTLTLNANTKILQSQVDVANAKGWTIAGGTIVSEEEYYG